MATDRHRRYGRVDFPSRGRRKGASDTGVSLTCVWVDSSGVSRSGNRPNRRAKAAGSSGVIAALETSLLFVKLGLVVESYVPE